MSTEPRFDSLFLLRIAQKYMKFFLITAIASIILAVVFSSSFFITPMFKSEAIVYPQNLIPYSTESPTEQMLQLFESNDIRDALIEDFGLMQHYEVDSTQKYPLTILHNIFKENITIDKTRFESVQIIVKDKDPKVASNLVDSIISKHDQKARSLQREKSQEVVVIFKNQLDYYKFQMDSMENVLKDIRMDYGILDFEEQMNSFSRIYYTAVKDGAAGSGNRPMDKIMHNMQLKGGEAMALKEHLWRIRGTYNDVKLQYEDALKDLTKVLTYSNIVTKPVPAEKKSYPVRSLIVIIFTVSVLLFTLISVIIFENFQRLRSIRTNAAN